MKTRILSALAFVALIGCGDPAATTEECTSHGVASLQIDPLGRGDGIDLTASEYPGRCYQDDEMEANRPRVDHWQVAADAAAAIAAESQALADQARTHIEDLEEFIAERANEQTNTRPSFESAWYQYVALITAAKFATEEAYQIGLVLLAPERQTSWEDIADHPDVIIKDLASEFREGIVGLNETPLGIGIAGEILTRAVKAAMLDFLEAARDTALEAYEALPEADQSSDTPPPGVDPSLLNVLGELKEQYEAARAQAAIDSRAAIEANWAAINAVSEVPPCDSEELREYLDYWLCEMEFVNPVSPEAEAETPGITATIDAYVADVCEAVTYVCLDES